MNAITPASPADDAHRSAVRKPAVRKPAVRRTAARRTAGHLSAVRSTVWLWLPLVLALLATPVLFTMDTRAGLLAPVWFVAVIWTILANLFHSLWLGLRHGDWSAFGSCDVSRDDEGHDWATRTGQFAFMRIRAQHEALTRDSERFLENHDHLDSPG